MLPGLPHCILFVSVCCLVFFCHSFLCLSLGGFDSCCLVCHIVSCLFLCIIWCVFMFVSGWF